LQIQQPSLQNVLEVLNALNGIVFVQLRPVAQVEEPLD
jgi:hypothetical protein